MLARRRLWKFLAAVFFLFGIVLALPFWLVSKIGRGCFHLANLFMVPFELCRTVARGGAGPYDRVKHATGSKWRIVRDERRVAEVIARGRGRR